MSFILNFNNSKRAVSPLVATVLLIAFAVSLGAVIMNWTSGVMQEGSSKKGPSQENSICNLVHMFVMDGGTEKSICFDRISGKIKLDIENGPVKINGLRLSYLSTNQGYVDFEGDIEAGVLSHIELNYDVVLHGEINNLKVVPMIYGHVCSDGGESFSSIRDC